jgi:phosphatidylserine/phosphatidylglycerophosphate/cardiolipin synthase-like enzyme
MVSTTDEEDGGETASVWRYAKASRAHVVIDAAAYFELMHEAMLRARQKILLIGWDFDSRIHLSTGRRWWNMPRKDRFPARLGALMIWLVRRKPELQIRVLKWNFGALKFLLRGSMILDVVRWLFQPGIDFKFDSAHPLGCSHHQKIVVIDDRMAACGGIDMTSDRWDTPEHLHEDPRRRRVSGRPYAPWHDITMMLEGEAACMLGDLGRHRWRRAGGKPLEPCDPQEASPWPKRLKAEFRDVEIGIARTRAAYRGSAEVNEIKMLFLEQIARAKRFIYLESQYFASRSIAEAIARRVSEPNPPEILLLNPLTADGWLAQASMDAARVRLLHAIAEVDHSGAFRVFVPLTSGGAQIYVHAKLMIVDDEIVRVGSANLNNRSMGLDTEADVFIDATRPGNEHIVPAITGLRHTLLAEHCGIEAKDVPELLERHGSMSAMIDALAESRRQDSKRLEAFTLRPLTEAEKAVADNSLLDPERPEEMFEPIGRRRGLFRRDGLLRKPGRASGTLREIRG